jgi:hypothetical protein
MRDHDDCCGSGGVFVSNVIDFKTPAQLREELTAKEAECLDLQAKLSKVKGVNEMLKIQILDLQDQLSGLVGQMELVRTNLTSLAGKLPNLD